MGRRFGIYSGTFDPIHPGHVAFALKTLQVCKLNEIVFLPETKPRDKQNVTDITHRVALIERATRTLTGLRVLRLASEQFTIQDTLPKLHHIFGDSQLTFLVGSDVAQTLYLWDSIGQLLQKASLAIGVRPHTNPEQIEAAMKKLEREHKASVRYAFIHTPESHLASSHIRSGKVDISRLHPAMLEYIQKHDLYA